MIEIRVGDALEQLREMPPESVHCCVSSPPYWGLRDYGVDGQIGLEETQDEWCARLVEVFREVKRVLRKDGTCWVNVGDSYAGSWGNQGRKSERGTQRPINGEMMQRVDDGRYPANGSNTGKIPDGTDLKPKDLIGQPWLLAFALRADGWFLRDAIVWNKPNPMPESVRDRCTNAYEHVFLLAKSKRYFFDAEAIKDQSIRSRSIPGGNGIRRDLKRQSKIGAFGGPVPEQRNCRNVWTIATEAFSEAHFATFPTELARRCILAGCPVGGTVLDPFGGAGTTALVADRLQRNAVLIELNAEYAAMAQRRIDGDRGGLLDLMETNKPLESAGFGTLY